ncbi:hypothetical protein PHYBOEH_009339 [Phytophthora boehmeriae]|uniref:4'-phosphopantetheinyl transferase domain-containing protein n=1 Tax=Phytophthora boehmeriae TaxID=109152 RepID=A0A8T1VXI2_9STRA|nr:hypothetical protein PHYBOEH_009339 [Phytophthora boehmeriae]
MTRALQRFIDVDAWDVSSPDWHRLLGQLPVHEQQQVTRFMFAKDQKLALASRLMQRQLIHDLFQTDYNAIDIQRTPENKPYWKRPNSTVAPPLWNYNVSHHGTIVAIASDSRSLVGVDVVRVTDRPHRKTSIEEFFRAFAGHFNPNEWRYIRGDNQDEEGHQYARFYRLWSLKEAFIKAIGIGLGFCLLRAEFVRMGTTERWELILDGQLARDWKFSCTQINSTHIVSVARGPITAMWKPETSSLFANDVAYASEQAVGSKGDTDQTLASWQELGLQDLLQ